MEKGCGVVIDAVTQNGLSATLVAPNEGIVKWEHVSTEFKAKFMDTWNQHYKQELKLIDGHIEDKGDYTSLNWLYTLDEVGWAINQGFINKSDTFEDAVKKALDL